MAVKFLDNTGLGYFWSKIKAWALATFAAITHNQASNTINAMTGYSKPSTTSAISVSDTLNQAIGKLEKAIDAADISNVVHLTGNEHIYGAKHFYDTLRVHTDVYNRSSAISSGQYQADAIEVVGSDNNLLANLISTRSYSSSGSSNYTGIRTWGADGGWADLNIHKDDDGSVYATLWSYAQTVPKFSIRSQLTIDNILNIRATDILQNNENTSEHFLLYSADSNGAELASLFFARGADQNRNLFRMRLRNANNKWCDFYISYNDSNSCHCGLTSSGDSTNLGFYGNALTATTLETSRTIRTNLGSTSAASFNGSANVTPGVTGTLPIANGGTGSSTKNFVDLSNDQTIGGIKTLTSYLYITRGTPILTLTNTSTTSGSDYADLRFVTRGVDAGLTMRLRAWYDKNVLLYGTHTSAATGNGALLELQNSGNVALSACAGASGTRRYLTCGTGGTLTWNGQTVQTSSDERLKTPISAVPDEVLDTWDSIEWGQFQFLDAVKEKGSDKARQHVGLIAQKVNKIFIDAGLDILKYGILCHEVRETAIQEARVVDHEAYIDENGVEHAEEFHIERDVQQGYDQWQARYVEALCMEAAYQRRKNKILENRISELEKQVSDMLLILQSLKGAN